MVNAWAIDAAGGAPSYAGYDLRMGTIAPHFAGAGTSTGVRTGVRPSGSGTDLLVQAQSSPNMSVLVNPGVIIVQGTYAANQGPYTWALDTQTTLTIANSHATLDRIDLVCARIRDGNVDASGSRDGSVMVVTGTAGGGVPGVPTDATYVVISQVSVPHASSSVTSGQITDKRPFTSAAGGVIVCTSATRPSSPAPGQPIFETDTGVARRWTGSAWVMIEPLRTGAGAPLSGTFIAGDWAIDNSGAQWRCTAGGSPGTWQITGHPPLYAYKTADTSITASVVLANDPDLVVPVVANATYEVEGIIVYTAPGGPGAGQFKFGWATPSGVGGCWVGMGIAVNNAAATNGPIGVDQSLWTDARSYGAMSTSQGTTVLAKGTLTTGSSAGNLQMQWAQAAASGTTTVRAGSRLSVRRLA